MNGGTDGFNLNADANHPKDLEEGARRGEKKKKARRKATMVRAAWMAGLRVVAIVVAFAFTSGEPALGVTGTENWDLPALDDSGEMITLARFEGTPTVATFFATWCHICQQELPGFAQLEVAVGDQVNFVGINTMNNGSGLTFAHEMGIGSWPLARDVGLGDGRQLATNFGARGSPTTVLYDDEGNGVDVTLGGLTAEQLEVKLAQFFGVRN